MFTRIIRNADLPDGQHSYTVEQVTAGEGDTFAVAGSTSITAAPLDAARQVWLHVQGLTLAFLQG